MRSLLYCCLSCVLIAGYLPCYAAGSPRLSNGDSLRPFFLLEEPREANLTAEDQLSLYLIRGLDTAALPVAAAYAISGAGLEMRLLSELDWNTSYLLRWKTDTVSHAEMYRTPDRQPHQAPRLLRRYPLSDSVPANLLYFQFRFDQAMRPDVDAWARVHIREDVAGAADVPYAWRQHSIWLDSGRVLQMMVHPGRVKSGIDYGGPLLQPGKRYVITLDSGLQGQYGNALPAQPAQHFIVTPPDHAIPHLLSCTNLLSPGTRDAVRLGFSEAMDFSGLLTGARLLNAQSEEVAFTLVLAEDGHRCELIPATSWQRGDYWLELNAELRDLAANTLRRPFEVRRLRETRKDNIPFRYSLRVE